MNYEIGDTVKVKNSGKIYSSYLEAAKILGADYDPSEYEKYLKGNLQPWQLRKTAFKFTSGFSCCTGDLATVKNIAQVEGKRHTTELVLIERLSDNTQYVIGISGLVFHKRAFLEDDLFEL